MSTNNGKGDVRAQKKRRSERLKFSLRQQQLFPCIDDNWTHYPISYCSYHKGYLTAGLRDVHRCELKGCKMYKPLQFDRRGRVVLNSEKRG